MRKKGQSTLEYLVCISIVIFACLVTVPKVVKSYNNTLNTVTNSMIDSSHTITNEINKDDTVSSNGNQNRNRKGKK